MLVYVNGFLKCGAPGVPFVCDKRESFFTKTTWGFYRLPSGPGDRVYFNNSKYIHHCAYTCFMPGEGVLIALLASLDLSYSSKSIEVVEKAAIDMGAKEDKADNPALSSYDDAMEALSTLISRRNRGDRSPTRGSRDKLEQVGTYLKVIQRITVNIYLGSAF